jgi:membrane protein implicated in regulation of membrane protease activity
MSAFLVYLFCLIVGAAFVLGSAVFGHMFGGGDGHVAGSGGHAEAGADGSDSPGVSMFSPTILASFVTAFGGIGIILQQFPSTKPPMVSALLAALGASIMAAVLLWVMRQVFAHSESSSESQVATLKGMSATIITPIPENGVGEIAYVQAGTRYTAAARTENGEAVPSGRAVTITSIVAGQFFVKAN